MLRLEAIDTRAGNQWNWEFTIDIALPSAKWWWQRPNHGAPCWGSKPLPRGLPGLEARWVGSGWSGVGVWEAWWLGAWLGGWMT